MALSETPYLRPVPLKPNRAISSRSWSYGGRSTFRASGRGGWYLGAAIPQAREQYLCVGYLTLNGLPHRPQGRSKLTILFLRPQCVSSAAAQFGQTIWRFSSRLSLKTPLM